MTTPPSAAEDGPTSPRQPLQQSATFDQYYHSPPGDSPVPDDAQIRRPRRTGSRASSIRGQLRRLSNNFEESRIPVGLSAATADFASTVFSDSAPSGSTGQQLAHGSPAPGRLHRSGGTEIDTVTEHPYQPEDSSVNGWGQVIHDREGNEHIVHDQFRHREGGSDSGSGDEHDKSGADESMLVKTHLLSSSALATDKEEPRGEEEEASEKLRQPQRSLTSTLTAPFRNGYHFPPAYSTGHKLRKGLVAFGHFVRTPMGFFWTIYGLNVVAWGGMLFLLLCNAAPAMCYPTCNDINSPRRKWIEYDSQILNALFCVTGFGLAPWRFRDMYFLLQFRLFKRYDGLRRLAAIYRTWIRLPSSDSLPVHIGPHNVADYDNGAGPVPCECLPSPTSLMADAPPTGTRAPPTKLWKVDLALWLNVSNTFLQAVLSGFMWGMDRFTRPSWSTGLFVAMACIVAALGGQVMFLEGKRVKSIEGVALTEEDRETLARDAERGILHYNNLKDKRPKMKVRDEEGGGGGEVGSETRELLGRGDKGGVREA